MGRSVASANTMSLIDFTALALASVVFLFMGADGTIFVADPKANTQEVDEKLHSRFVRREPMADRLAESPHSTHSSQSLEDAELELAKQTAMAAAGRKAVAEMKMQELVQEMKHQEEEADKKRLEAENTVRKLEAKKAELSITANANTHKEEFMSFDSTPDLKTDPKIDMLAEAAKKKAMAAERRKFESLQRATRNHLGVGVQENDKATATEKTKTTEMTLAKEKSKAEKQTEEHAEGEKIKTEKKEQLKADQEEHHKAAMVSGLPEIAFASDAWMVMDAEEHHANLLNLIAERKKAAGGSESEEDESSGDIWCDKDYPLGLWNTSQCSSDGAGDHVIIEMEEMCIQAAKQANATAGDGRLQYFRIPAEWGDLHPKGCFVFPCHWDPGHVCYWYNAQEEEPLYPWGAPVCQRPLFRNGTEDTNGGCPEGYDVILNENNCSEAGRCKAYCNEPNFIVGVSYPRKNASLHNEYPEGCFIHKEQGCVYYNPRYGVNPPQNPKGTPLCNVTQITHFPEIPLPWDVFW